MKGEKLKDERREVGEIEDIKFEIRYFLTEK